MKREQQLYCTFCNVVIHPSNFFFFTCQISFQFYCIVSCGTSYSYSTYWNVLHWVRDMCFRIGIISSQCILDAKTAQWPAFPIGLKGECDWCRHLDSMVDVTPDVLAETWCSAADRGDTELEEQISVRYVTVAAGFITFLCALFSRWPVKLPTFQVALSAFVCPWLASSWHSSCVGKGPMSSKTSCWTEPI